MKNKHKLFTLFILAVIVVFVSGCTTGNLQDTGLRQGRLVVGITDAAANLDNVNSVAVTIDKVEVHSSEKGWITLNSTPQTFNLLELKARSATELLADATLEQGSYQQIRLSISSVIVTDQNETHEAKLPSNELKITGNFDVDANSTTTATLDFIANESLHMTGKGDYILAPVIQLETRENADVEIGSDNNVKVKEGKVKTNIKVGMDVNGNVDVGLKIPENAGLSIGQDSKIKIGA